MTRGKVTPRKSKRLQSRKVQSGGQGNGETQDAPVPPTANFKHPHIRTPVLGYNGWEKVTVRNNPVVTWWENKELKEHRWNPPGEEEIDPPIVYTEVEGLPDGWKMAHHIQNINKQTPWYEFGVNSNNATVVPKTSWTKPMLMLTNINRTVAPAEMGAEAPINTVGASQNDTPYNTILQNINSLKNNLKKIANTLNASKVGGTRRLRKTRRSRSRSRSRSSRK
jgi:hypothetical protein